jgi:hypothetical protein
MPNEGYTQAAPGVPTEGESTAESLEENSQHFPAAESRRVYEHRRKVLVQMWLKIRNPD